MLSSLVLYRQNDLSWNMHVDNIVKKVILFEEIRH